MRFSSNPGTCVHALGLGLCLMMAVGNQASAEPAACAIPVPAGVPVPEGLNIQTCSASEKITGFHGKAPLPAEVDASFAALKATYKADGFALYDNSHGKIRSVIFGGKGHRKGEIQLNPKDGYLSVSINLYPADITE
jgi:hypothetical protein